MSSFGNLPHVHVRKESRHRTHHDNMNWDQETSTAEKEDDIDSTATMETTTFTPTTIKAEKEDNADSTATTTTAAATSVFGSEWEHYVTEGLAETTTLDEKIYIFGER